MDARNESNDVKPQTVLSLCHIYDDISTLTQDIETRRLAEVFKSPLLEEVYFENNALGYLKPETLAIFASFFKNTNIKKLHLGSNNFGQLKKEHINSLITELKDTPIQTLSLNHNQLRHWGADTFSFFTQQLMTHMGKLRLLSLEDNELWWRGKAYLTALEQLVAGSNIMTLQLDGNLLEYFLPETYKNKPLACYSDAFVSHLEHRYLRASTLHPVAHDNPLRFSPYQFSLSDLQMIRFKLSLKDEVDQFVSGQLPSNTGIDDTKSRDHRSAVSTSLNSIEKLLMRNRTRDCTTLKGLAMLSIYSHPNINWRQANIPNDLKADLENERDGHKPLRKPK